MPSQGGRLFSNICKCINFRFDDMGDVDIDVLSSLLFGDYVSDLMTTWFLGNFADFVIRANK